MEKKTILIAAILVMASMFAHAQSVQYGYTEEYRGTKEKKPLSGVIIDAGGATTKSGSGGKFRLEFNTLKVGDRIYADIQNVVTLKGYVLFNREAVEQWTVSGKDSYFRIVLCNKKTFDDLVMTYYNVSDRSLTEQLKKERDNAKRLKEQGEIQQQEYERLLKEADNRYNDAFKHIRENAELVARIDESELEGNQAEILRLAKEGRLDEAVALIRQDSTAILLEKTTRKIEYAEEQERQAKALQEEAKNERAKLIANLKSNIKILKLQGGKENFDLCKEYWQKIIEADTANLDNLWDGAEYFKSQNNFRLAEKYYQIVLSGYRQLYEQNQEVYYMEYIQLLNALGILYYNHSYYREAKKLYLQEYDIYKSIHNTTDGFTASYVQALNNLALLYKRTDDYPKANDYFMQALSLLEPLAVKNPEKYNEDYSSLMANLGVLKYEMKLYDEAEVLFVKAISIREKLAEQNPDKHNETYAGNLINLATLYDDIHQYQKSEKYFLQGLEMIKQLAEKNPDAYSATYALALDNIASLYENSEDYAKSEEYYLRSLELRRKLAEVNPDANIGYFSMSLNNIAILYARIKQYDKAEQYWLESLTIDKSLAEQYPDVYNASYASNLRNLGIFYYKTKQFIKAENQLKQSMEIRKSLIEKNHERYADSYASVLRLLSSVVITNKHFTDSEKYAREALAIDTNHIETKAILALSILFQGRYAEAEKLALEIKDIEWNGKSMKKVILKDLTKFESDGVIPEELKGDVERFRKVLSL